MTLSETDNLDPAKADAFGERMVGILNGGCLALMASIGHQTGLFDTMAELQASTAHDIGNAAGLHERYVREWLGAMVTGGIVEYDPTAGTYRLPAEHAAFLTRAAGTDNLAVTAQFIALLAAVEDQVAQCFRTGGGVPYSATGGSTSSWPRTAPWCTTRRSSIASCRSRLASPTV